MGQTTLADVSARPVERFLTVRRQTERLAAPLTAEDCMMQSMPDASPTKWHMAHTTWFFETFLLNPHLENYRPLDPRYTFLYNSYYKSLGGHPVRAQRGLISRPTLDEVRDYRRYVDEHMALLLERGVEPEIAAIFELGLNHEQQHQELIVTDIKHALWSGPLRPAYMECPRADARAPGPLSWIQCKGGLHWVGHEGSEFAFDNESPRHRVFLEDYCLASRLVTSAEYMEFMADRGYARPELWLSDGWDAVNDNGWEAPLYWVRERGEWRQFTLAGMRDIEADEPVCHVSLYEADAYARWAGARLATEAEWEAAASLATLEGNFLEDMRLHPHPAPLASDVPPGRAAQMFGDVWEWTSSAYLGYPGYRPTAGALGEYNGKFMSGQMVLRGGSCATPRSHIRATYRNFFPPHSRWQFMGIRLANDCT